MFTNDGLNIIVRLTFVNGFPDNIRVNLLQASHITTMSKSDIISRTRILSSKIFKTGVDAVSLRNMPIEQASPSMMKDKDFNIKCFRFGEACLIKNCTERVSCFKCKKFGHIASNCEQGEG